MELSMKNIRKEMNRGKIVLSLHVQDELLKRGYFKKDLIQCLWNGEITKLQFNRGEHKAVIEGYDTDNSPIVVVIGFYRGDRNRLAIITAFPPIKEKFKRRVG